MYYYWDPTYILLIPAILLSIYASAKVRTTTSRYFKVKIANGYTGSQIARYLLDMNHLNDVSIEVTNGNLSDHYDPRKKIIRLSKDVYYGDSITSVAVAAHECGHAIQHATSYVPLVTRHALVPIVNFCSNISWILFFVGMLFSSSGFLQLGILLFSSSVLFHIVTLPVEFNASNRALKQLNLYNILEVNEVRKSKKVLNAAAMTYISATLMSLMQLLRLIAISRRND